MRKVWLAVFSAAAAVAIYFAPYDPADTTAGRQRRPDTPPEKGSSAPGALAQHTARLNGSDADQRLEAAYALAAAGGRHLQPLFRALRTGDDALRLVVIRSLKRHVKNADVQAALIEAAGHGSNDIALAVLNALNSVASEAALPLYVSLVGHADTDVAKAAIRNLPWEGPLGEAAARLGAPAALGAVVAARGALTHPALYKLEWMGAAARPALPAVLDALRDDDHSYLAAAVLGNIGPDAAAAIPLLVARLRELEKEDLESLHETSLIPASGPSIPWGDALGGIGAASIPALQPLMKTESWDTRYQVMKALAGVGSPAIPFLMSTLKSPHARERETAL
ncbi:MAG: HEAT repeat domain-containing protein, partial [Planctomycetota bacterium]|nr:HEAT repeat domain-containing protein [Planctomycetota bacterium]